MAKSMGRMIRGDRSSKGSRPGPKWTLTTAGIARHWAGHRGLSRKVLTPLALPARPRRLFAAACLRSPRVWSVLDGPAREAVELAERQADGLASDDEIVEARCHVHDSLRDQTGTLRWAAGTAVLFAIESPDALMRPVWDQLFVSQITVSGAAAAVFAQARESLGAGWTLGPDEEGMVAQAAADAIGDQELQAVRRAEWSYQGQLLAGIVAPDWRLAPAWRTDTAVQLARGIYDERAFDRMPILADALQDAGCDNDEWLVRMRDPHWAWCRGCHVVDSLVGTSAP